VLQTFLRQHEPALHERVNGLFRVLEGLDESFALPLTELALPRLQLMTPEAQRALLGRLQEFARLDRRISTFEFALLMLLRKQLLVSKRARPVKLEQCLPAVSVVIATLLRVGSLDGEKLERSYVRLMRTISTAAPPLPAPGSTGFVPFAKGLQILEGLPLQDKRNVLELAATAVLADAQVRQEEYELLRVVAAFLGCPMPMLDV
jgi:hypothetical protein